MNMNHRLIEAFHRLSGRKRGDAVKRKQFNLVMNEEIILGVKLIAATLEVPIYVACEHILQVGSQYLIRDMNDSERRVSLKNHLVNVHLLGK
jgi:hypothetical protein